jgi:hypothetical protein
METRNQNRLRLRVEQLEDRLAPTVLTVTPPVTLPSSAHAPSGLTIGAAASHAQATAHSAGVVMIK